MAIIAQAPVNFCGTLTTASGTGEQIFQVSTAGVTAGLASGNIYIPGIASNLIANTRFKVVAGGWYKSHGTSQTIAPAILWQTYTANTNTLASSPADTFTSVASATLTAGTVYDWSVSQDFYVNVASGTVSGSAPQVTVAGKNVTISTLTAPLAVNNLGLAVQTEPITGINNTVNYPSIAFAVSLTNGVSDTVATALVTSFYLAQD